METGSDCERQAGAEQHPHRIVTEAVDRHKHGLVNYLTRLLADRARAEDLAQEAFVRFFLTRGRYEERGRVVGYLYRIATNLALSEARRDTRWRRLMGTLMGTADRSFQPTPHCYFLAGEAESKLLDAIAELPFRFRVPLVLHEIEGLGYDEVASVIGCEKGTVKSRVSRGRSKLKRRLAPYYNGGE